jgi:hypothetical protein
MTCSICNDKGVVWRGGQGGDYETCECRAPLKGVEIKSFMIVGEEGACIKGYQDNMGEPYRSGVTLWICKDGNDRGSGVFIQSSVLDDLITSLQAIRKSR